MDPKPPKEVRHLVARLGDLIGGSVSNSDEVNSLLERIRGHGYHIYVMLDATIGVDRDRKKAYDTARRRKKKPTAPDPLAESAEKNTRRLLYSPEERDQFQLNRGDVRFLESLGIDGTRHIRQRPTNH